MTLICFDVGNVLVKLRCAVSTVDEPLREEYAHLTQLYGVGGLERQAFLGALKRLFGWQCDLSEVESWFVHQRIEKPQPGVEALLAQLHKKGVPIAVLSNTNASHWAYLKTFELFQGCLINVLSFEQQCAKPDARIYQRLEALSGFQGEQIIYFDDIEVNVQAAGCRGWITCLVNPVTAIDQIQECLRGHGVL